MAQYLRNKKIKLMINGRSYNFMKPNMINYVSFGDSIAGGHTINADWERDYGEGSQYGKNGNTSTVIVPNCYTDLITKELQNIYRGRFSSSTSFARSGDTVSDLLDKLSHDVVVKANSKADIVTICIGANDILSHVFPNLMGYVETGSLSTLEAMVDNSLGILNNDSHPSSYKALFDRLNEINPKAKYAFTTIYNPYKYLWLEDGPNGFFGPVLNVIPNMEMFGFNITSMIKDQLLSTSIVRLFFDRVNGLDDWVEKYITKLNTILRNKVNNYKSTNPNFILADTKEMFDKIPDRPITAEKHYNDLVSVEFTRGYDTAKMDWGNLWGDTDIDTYWFDLASKYVSLSGMDMNGFATDLISQIVSKVILPDIDPHPEEYGHYVIKRVFEDALGLNSLNRLKVTYNANGGTGSMDTQTVVALDGYKSYININPATYVHPTVGYHFVGWNTKADGTGTSYSNGQFIGLSGDITLYAQWSNVYTVTYKHTNHTDLYPDDGNTGHKECYALYINGVLQDKFGEFDDGNSKTIPVAYGSTIRVVCDDYRENDYTTKTGTCDVYWNGTSVANGWGGTEYTFTLTGNITIDFQWKISGSHVTFDARSWEDCYITTH